MKIGDGFRFMFGVMLFFFVMIGGTCVACGACSAGSLMAIGAAARDAGTADASTPKRR